MQHFLLFFLYFFFLHADKIIFSSVDETTSASCLIYAFWFLVANCIFNSYDALEHIYGVSDDEERPVVELLKEEDEEEQLGGGRNVLDKPLLSLNVDARL